MNLVDANILLYAEDGGSRLHDAAREWWDREHWELLQSLLLTAQATGNLVTDAHLAALAIEHNCMLCSTDADFSRFPGLRWTNPLA